MSAVTAGRESLTVGQYADLVRAALTWLSPEQLEDLTDGLEADLADSLADPTVAGASSTDLVDLVARFGPPEDYAAELASAAGWERPAPAGLRGSLRGTVLAMRRPLDARLSTLRAQRWWPPVAGFLLSLRPAWWVLRGWLLYQPIAMVYGPSPQLLPQSFVAKLVMLGLIVLSVQWGRGRLPARPWLHRAGLLASALAVILLVPVLSSVNTLAAGYGYGYAAPASVVYETVEPEAGVWVDGMQVSNLFVYDAEGNLVDGAQVFDDRGREVRTVTPQSDGYAGDWMFPGAAQPWSFVATVDDRGVDRWNVYPLLGATSDRFSFDDRTGTWGLASGVEATAPPSPFGAAPTVSARIATEAQTEQGPGGQADPEGQTEDDPESSESPAASGSAGEVTPSSTEAADPSPAADQADAGDGEPSAIGTTEPEEGTPSPTATP